MDMPNLTPLKGREGAQGRALLPSRNVPSLHDDSDISSSDFESRFSPIFAADISSQKVSAPPFLFDPIFRSRTLTLISSEPYTGKTLLMLSMLLSIDAKFPLFGRFAPVGSHRCLFLGQDAPTWDYHAQFLKLFHGLGLSQEQEREISLPSLLMLNRGISVTSPDFFQFISAAVSIYGITILFLDTLLEFHPFDENSNREMAIVMRTLKSIRDSFGMTIIFSHHVSKGGSGNPEVSRNYRARGASVVAGSIDHHFYLSLKATEPEPLVSFEFAKGRGLALRSNPVSHFSIHSFYRTTGHEALSLIPAEKPSEDRIFDFLSVERSRQELEDFISSNSKKTLTESAVRSKVSRLLASLREAGKVSQLEHGKWVAI
jgi:hypothetical protein